MKKTGISLIVLIVTIIVIIILAAVVVLTLSKNNPIESAKEATFKEDIRTFQDELAMYISKDYTNKGGQRDEKINADKYTTDGEIDSLYLYIPSFSKKYEGKFVIKNDELMYKEGELTESEQIWSKDLNVKLNQKTGAEKAKENPVKYYGAKVTNYISNGISDWKIFYSDGSNIYLITSEYIDPEKLPEKDGVKPGQGDVENYSKGASFSSIVVKYNGSENITDDRIKKLNSDYFKERVNEETGETYVYTSKNNNMKSVAYMLDIEIWKDFAEGNGAEYAIGGPPIEMAVKSYSEKKNIDYRAQAPSAIGYQISNNGGKSWSSAIAEMFSKNEELYVLPEPSISGADGMWLASPSAGFSNHIPFITSNGSLLNHNWYMTYYGFRPLVCLNSNILLNEVAGGFEIE